MGRTESEEILKPFGNHPGARDTLDDTPIHEVVDEIGVGRAQLLVLFLASGGINFIDGAEISAISSSTLSAANDFGLGPNEKGMLVSFTLLGMFLGIVLLGHLGDTYGRKKMVLAAYALVSFSGLLSAFAQSYWALLLCRCVLGFGMGLGMPSSIALLSEITPPSHRMLMRSLSYVCWSSGSICVALLAATDDPHLVHLSWRRLFVFLSIPAGLLFIAALVFLPESPVYLESIGKHSEARATLARLMSLNGSGYVKVDYKVIHHTPKAGATMSLQDQLGCIFSADLCYTTLVVAYASCCTNLASYAFAYAAPQVLAETSATPAAYAMAISGVAACGINFLLWIISSNIPRKEGIIVSLSLGIVVMLLFTIAGSHSLPRPLFWEAVYQISLDSFSAASTLGYMVLFQIAVEIYPTCAAATGGSLIIGAGRLGAVLAPLVFERLKQFSSWQMSFYTMSSMNAIGILLLLWMPPVKVFESFAQKHTPRSSCTYASV